MKAYLAHSSEDKKYVDIVVTRLGRARVIYDRFSFDPGYDFRKLIREGLDKSTVFIFFVSKSSLERTWVRYEITEAEWRIIQGKISGALSIIIDDEVKISDLPPWMQRCLIQTVTYPQLAFHAIQSYLIQQSGSLTETVFIGRESDLSNFAQLLNPSIEDPVPRILVLAGLEGIGRKTFARRALRDYLALSAGSTFIIEETDTSERLYLQLMSVTTDFADRRRVAETIKTFRGLSDEEKGEEIARLIAVINRYNQVPILIDKGPESTFLDKSFGLYKEEWLNVLRGMKKYEDSYLLLIQPRLPYFPGMNQYKSEIPKLIAYRLGPLLNEAIEFILREGARRLNIEISTEQIKEITPYINGYPPAAKFSLAFIERYGADVLIAQKATLNSFLARQFESLLIKLELKKEEKNTLRILESVSSLPLDAISVLTNSSPTETAQQIAHLIDLSMVILVDSEYMISSPIRFAVNHTFGTLTRKEFSNIARLLRKNYWTAENEIPALSIVDATIYSLAYSDVEELNHFRDILLPTQILKAAWGKYHDRHWSDAEKLARRVLSLDPTLYSARVVLFKSVVRQRRWDLAEEILRVIGREGQIDRYYLRGFLEWRRGHYEFAVSLLRSGLNAGDRTFALLRDMSYCYFVLGRLKEAKNYIDRALERNRNKFTLDLAAEIAIFSDEHEVAQKYLSEIEQVDRLMYHHRLATLEWKEGKYEQALADEEIACDTEYPVYEALVQRIDILILLNRPDIEDEIKKLEPSFAEHSDIQRGLWCKHYLQKGEWGQAERWWKKIWQKKLPQYKELRKKILLQKTEDIMVEPSEREKAVAEISELEPAISLPLVSSEPPELETHEQ